jgi:anti-anti-sigma factor
MTAGPGAVDVRLHAPMPDVVVVRMSDPVDDVTGPVLLRRVDQQLGRARHVVIDLQDVQFLGWQFLQLLRDVHGRAVAVGAQLHVSAEHHHVRRSLRSSGLDQLVEVSPAAEMVVAGLLHGASSS